MPVTSPTGIGKEKPKWENPRGPKWLQEIIQRLFNEIGVRQPIEGVGVHIDETEGGRQINSFGGAGAQKQELAKKGQVLPFTLTVVPQTDNPSAFAVHIVDGKSNNEWPDVGTDTMGSSTSKGYQVLNIADINDSNIFLRVMFNYLTFEIARLDIYERPNATYPTNKIIFGVPVPGACDDVDDPETDPPAGYGRLNLLIGFTYVKPPPPGSPPGTTGTATAYNLVIGNINFGFVVGALNAQPALCPVTLYPGAAFIQVPTS